MVPIQPQPVLKKRRTFFSSNLPFIPKFAGTSRPATTPSGRVLAALLPPVLYEPPPEPPTRARERKQVRKDEENGRMDPVPRTGPSKEPSAPTRTTRPVRTSKTTEMTVIDGKRLAKATRTVPPVVATRRATKAQSAQSTNSKLSANMEMAMRSTISGREKPYMRDNTWTVMAVSKRKGKAKAEVAKKEIIAVGIYSHDTKAKSTRKCVKRVFERREVVKRVNGKKKAKGKGKGKGREVFRPERTARTSIPLASNQSFPLPEHRRNPMSGPEHDFEFPDIVPEAEIGSLNGEKPAPYQKICGNVFPERVRRSAGHTAVCRCEPESRCRENCINRIKSYLCGKGCPVDACENRSLARRKLPQTKVVYVRSDYMPPAQAEPSQIGPRGFGLVAMENIKAGDFVTDYRGEVISLNTFYDRIKYEYAGQKNFYALAYDQDEVIDAGMRGNDARFINHGCSPNMKVRKVQTLGDGFEEYEIGLWALNDVKQGEELFYDYNSENLRTTGEDLRTVCRCSAPNCSGFIGQVANEKAPATSDKPGKEITRGPAARNSIREKRSFLAIGTRAVEKSGEELYPVYTSSTPQDSDVTASEALDQTEKRHVTPITSPMNQVEEIPLATRFWRTEPRAREPLLPPAPSVSTALTSELPPVARAPPIARHYIPTTIPAAPPIDQPPQMAASRLVTSHSDSSARKTPAFVADSVPSEFAVSWRVAMSGASAKPSAALTSIVTPNSMPPPVFRFPGAPPHTSRMIYDAAEKIVNSIDRPNPYGISGNTTSVLSLPVIPHPVIHTHTIPRPSDAVTARPTRSDPGDEFGDDEDARKAAKRKSGWANWLKKQAGTKQRTLEEWHEERIKRRRGIAWMKMMIDEFGLAPSPGRPTAIAYSNGSKPAGSVMSFANTLAALGHPAGPAETKRLGGPGNPKLKEKMKDKANAKGKDRDKGKKTIQATDNDREAQVLPSPSNVMESEVHVITKAQVISDQSANVQPLATAHDPSRSEVVTWTQPTKRSAPFVTDSRSKKRSRPSKSCTVITRTEARNSPVAHLGNNVTPVAETGIETPPVLHVETAPPAAQTTQVAHNGTGKFSGTQIGLPPIIQPTAALLASETRSDIAHESAIPAHLNTTGENSNKDADIDAEESARRANETAKRKAIAARNGAPMGWAFVDPNTKPETRLVSAVEEDLPRSARRARTSLSYQEAIDNVWGRRRLSVL